MICKKTIKKKRRRRGLACSLFKDGQVVGLGTGSTAAFFIKLLAEKVKSGLRIRGIPTSVRSGELAESLGIPLTTLDDCQEIDVTVDGADEVDPQLRLIKGGGGAMLREKIVASATKQLVIVADASKQVSVLGKFPLPVEVIGFAQALVTKRITELGAAVSVRKDADGQPLSDRREASHSGLPVRADPGRGCVGAAVERHAGRGRAWAVCGNGEGGVVCAGE